MEEIVRAYVVCPKCGKFEENGDNWYVIFEEYNRYKVTVGDDGYVGYDLDDYLESYFDEAIHEPCGFSTKEYPNEIDMIEDLAVFVDEEKGEIVEVGGFWEKHIDKLRELAEKNGLKIARGVANE